MAENKYIEPPKGVEIVWLRAGRSGGKRLSGTPDPKFPAGVVTWTTKENWYNYDIQLESGRFGYNYDKASFEEITESQARTIGTKQPDFQWTFLTEAEFKAAGLWLPTHDYPKGWNKDMAQKYCGQPVPEKNRNLVTCERGESFYMDGCFFDPRTYKRVETKKGASASKVSRLITPQKAIR